ncbi:MAG: hypothetical protein JWP30_1872 [Homoserinimonas sp.]|jgi:hypothetical protein|nr:hypothetical protein [Homoserinimonas sp.]
MPLVTIVIGSFLTVAGVIAYAVTDAASLTALIPSVVGILMLMLGLLARAENLRRHAIHAALVVALLGALGSAMNVIRIGEVFAGTAERPVAIIVSTIMFVTLVVYVILGVMSFIRARRWKTENAA